MQVKLVDLLIAVVIVIWFCNFVKLLSNVSVLVVWWCNGDLGVSGRAVS